MISGTIRKLWALGGFIPGRELEKTSKGAGIVSASTAVFEGDDGKENQDPAFPPVCGEDTAPLPSGSFDVMAGALNPTMTREENPCERTCERTTNVIESDIEVRQIQSDIDAMEAPASPCAPVRRAVSRPSQQSCTKSPDNHVGSAQAAKWHTNEALTFGTNYPHDGTIEEANEAWRKLKLRVEELLDHKLWYENTRSCKGKSRVLDSIDVQGRVVASRTFKCTLRERCKCPFRARISVCSLEHESLGLEWSHLVVVDVNGEHRHDEGGGGSTTKGLSPNQRAFVARNIDEQPQQAADRLTLAARKDESLRPLPTLPPTLLVRVQNVFKVERMKRREGAQLKTLADLKELAETWPFTEAENDQAGIVTSEVNPNENVFRVLISTPRLLKLWRRGKMMRALDGTYKLCHEGLPLLVAGVLDHEHRFHVVAYALTSREDEGDWTWFLENIDRKLDVMRVDRGARDDEVLYVADAAMAIGNAIYAACGAPRCNIITCWYHVRMAHKRRVQSQPSKLKDASHLLMKRDNVPWVVRAFDVLHRQGNKLVFDALVDLFLNAVEERGEVEYLQYLKRQWLRLCPNWSRHSVPPGFPITNNGLERHNRSLKDSFYHRRPEVGKLVLDLLDQVHKKSVQMNPLALQSTYLTPAITKQDWIEAQQYMKKTEVRQAEDVHEHRARGIHVDEDEDVDLCQKVLGSLVFVPAGAAYHHWRGVAAEKNTSVHSICHRQAVHFAAMWTNLLNGNGAGFFDSMNIDFNGAVQLIDTFHVLEPAQEDANQRTHYSCTCLDFRRRAVCKHALSQSVRDGKMEIPPDFKLNLLVMGGRRGGRPRKTRDSLTRQPGEDVRPELLFPNDMTLLFDSLPASQQSAAPEEDARDAEAPETAEQAPQEGP